MKEEPFESPTVFNFYPPDNLIPNTSLLGPEFRIFNSMGGFDTHTNQLPEQDSLFNDLNQSLSAFYQATVEMGVASNVTMFTLSDFGRTYSQ
jgi:uncharacterized protein (DUF1501 family)